MSYFDLEKYVERLQDFKGELVIQTCFLRGEHNGLKIDNTTQEEIALWTEHIKKINWKNLIKKRSLNRLFLRILLGNLFFGRVP